MKAQAKATGHRGLPQPIQQQIKEVYTDVLKQIDTMDTKPTNYEEYVNSYKSQKELAEKAIDVAERAIKADIDFELFENQIAEIIREIIQNG